MTAESPTSLPPLSAAAEEVLEALEASLDSSDTKPHDPISWLSALIDEHPEELSAQEGELELGAVMAAVDVAKSSDTKPNDLTRAEIVALAGGKARVEGRPIISSQDIIQAALRLVVKKLRATGESPDDRAPTHPRPGTLPFSVEVEPDPLASSEAAEEMLEDLSLRLGIEGEESESVFRWLDTLLDHYPVSVGGEDGERKLEALRNWGIRLLASEKPTLRYSARQIRLASGEYARAQGRSLSTPEDLAIAIVKAAAEVRAGFEAGSLVEVAGETESEPGAIPDSGPSGQDATGEMEDPESSAEGPNLGSPIDTEPGTVHSPPLMGEPIHGRNRTFRLFVSSTFQDLQAERNVLQKTTFPRLRDFCARRGARFQAIDLRWGVSEEAGIDQQTMNICLGEIRRCHQVTPKPNFLILLGDRYGWLPPPPQIPAREFERILETLDLPNERDRLVRWYRKDLNADPPEYRLRPRTGEMEEYRNWDAWNPVEESIRKTLEKATGEDGLGLPALRRKMYRASATEQEVLAGALDVTEPGEKVFCYFRRLQGYPVDDKGDPLKGPDAFISAAPEDRDRLQRLKLRLIDHLPESSIQSRNVAWGGQGPELTDEYLADLADWLEDSLKAAILRELAQPAAVHGPSINVPGSLESDPALFGEVREHLAFAEERRRFFVGREDVLGEISEYVREEATEPLTIVGEGGTGKSALMAEATRRIEEANSEEVLVVRFVGATPGSSEGRFLLESLCRELALRYGQDPGEIPTDYQELVPKLAEQFGLASPEQPLVLLMDSLDQLSDPALGLSWIPSPLPPHVRMVVSTRPDDVRDRLEHRGTKFLDLGPLSRGDGADLLHAWLSSGSPPRRLQANQTKAVLDAFSAAGGNPLYLKLATEEARGWPAWAGVREETPENSPIIPLANGVREIIRDNLLDRLAHDDNHGSVLVSRAVGYLAASRYGLAEDELIAILSRDPDVYAWFLKETMHLPPDLIEVAQAHWSDVLSVDDGEKSDTVKQEEEVASRLQKLRENPEELRALLTDELGLEGLNLPVVFWSRLFFDLEPYFTEKRAEDGDLLSFYHRELGDVAAKEYLTDGVKEEIHGRLADFFRSQADPKGNGAWDGEGVRGLSELPYHLTKAGRWDEVYETLTDFSFLEQKAARVGIVERVGSGGEKETLYTGVFQLQDDFDRALQIMPGGEGGRKDAHPLIVTAVDFGEGIVVRCPWCNTEHPLVQEWLGTELPCPNAECGGPLKVNTFTVGGGGEKKNDA